MVSTSLMLMFATLMIFHRSFFKFCQKESRRSRRQFQKKISNAVFTSRKENYSSCLNIISVADVMIVVQLCKIVEKVGDPSFRGQPLNYFLDEYENKLEKNQKLLSFLAKVRNVKSGKQFFLFQPRAKTIIIPRYHNPGP